MAQTNAREETLRLRQQLADSECAREETQQLRRKLADSEEERRLLQEDVAEHKQLLHDVMTEAEQLRADVQRLADSEQSARASLEVAVHSSVRSVRSVRSTSSGAGDSLALAHSHAAWMNACTRARACSAASACACDRWRTHRSPAAV